MTALVCGDCLHHVDLHGGERGDEGYCDAFTALDGGPAPWGEGIECECWGFTPGTAADEAWVERDRAEREAQRAHEDGAFREAIVNQRLADEYGADV